MNQLLTLKRYLNQIVNKWIEENYKFLMKWSKVWAGESWGDLLTHFTFYLHKNWTKFSQIPDGEQRLKFSQAWFKNNVRWTNSDFNVSITVNNLPEGWEPPEEEYDDLIELRAEMMRGDISDWMYDLHTNFGQLEVDRLMKLRQIYLSLATHDKVLYDLYFTNMLTMRQIGDKLDLPLSAVFTMVSELKNKIKQQC